MAAQNYSDLGDLGISRDGSTDTADTSRDNNHQQSWQAALAQRNAMQQAYPVDPSNGLHYAMVNGKKKYFEPIMTPAQYLQWVKDNGEGVFHNAAEWNPDTGKYEHSVDWLKVAAIVGGGADAGSIAYGAFAGGGPAADSTLASSGDASATAATDAGTTAAETGGGAGVGGGGGTAGGSGAYIHNAVNGTANTALGGGAGGGGGFSTFVKGMGGYQGLAGIGTNLLGSYLQSRALNNASDAQLQGNREALGVQTQEFNSNMGLNVAQANQNTQAYNTTVANLAPYRGIGAGAASLAGYSLGIPGYEQGNRTVVNAPPPVVPVQPLAVPPPVSVNGQPGQAMPNQTYLPTNQITNGQPQMSTGNSWSPSSPTQGAPRQPQVGEQRQIQGQLATWDGRGWKAAQQQQGAA